MKIKCKGKSGEMVWTCVTKTNKFTRVARSDEFISDEARMAKGRWTQNARSLKKML